MQSTVFISYVPSKKIRTCWASSCSADGRSTWPECWGAGAIYAARYLGDGKDPPPKHAHVKLYRRVAGNKWVLAPRLEQRALEKHADAVRSSS